MQNKLKTLFISIAIPLIVGGLSAFISGSGTEMFDMLQKPPLSPPGWLFPIVWTVLYVLMGIASYLIVTSEANPEKISNALKIYAIQLVVNFFWSIFFFNFELYLFSFIWLVLLWILVLFSIIRFADISKTAAFLLIPYILWITFAGYLNFAIFLLN